MERRAVWCHWMVSAYSQTVPLQSSIVDSCDKGELEHQESRAGFLVNGKHIDKPWALAYTQQEEKNPIGQIEPGRVA